MKKQKVLTIFAVLFTALSANAQYYVGSSTSNGNNIFGNTTTIHRDSYGNITGKSVTGDSDIFGNTTTTHHDKYGNTIGFSR